MFKYAYNLIYSFTNFSNTLSVISFYLSLCICIATPLHSSDMSIPLFFLFPPHSNCALPSTSLELLLPISPHGLFCIPDFCSY